MGIVKIRTENGVIKVKNPAGGDGRGPMRFNFDAPKQFEIPPKSWTEQAIKYGTIAIAVSFGIYALFKSKNKDSVLLSDVTKKLG